MSRLPAASQALDFDHLGRQTFGDRGLERELLTLFEQQCVRLMPVIAGESCAIGRGDAAHALKGAALAIGASRVAAAAEAFEEALDGGVPAYALMRVVGRLEEAVGAVRVAIGRRRD